MGRGHAVGCRGGSREEVDADLALLNSVLGCLLHSLPECCNVWILIGRGEDGLDKEFVSALDALRAETPVRLRKNSYSPGGKTGRSTDCGHLGDCASGTDTFLFKIVNYLRLFFHGLQ